MATTTHQVPPLRAIRLARGLGLREFSRRTGLDPAHVSRVERGQAGLSLEALYLVACDLDLTELATLLRMWVPAALVDERVGRSPAPTRRSKNVQNGGDRL
jgi:transcriptional regulator with XRE-family HTH domain